MAKILVVEDEIIVAWDIKETLEKLGHTVVDLSVSGAEAIESAATDRPDLVLMDIRLEGEIDGIAAGDEIYHRLKIPVVYLTAHADEFTLERATKTSPFGYIIKPFQSQSLQSTIKVALQRHQVEVSTDLNQLSMENLNINSIGSGVISTDRQGLVTFMNPIAEELTGWQSSAAIGIEIDRVFCLIWETDGTQIENPSSRAMRLKAPIKSPDRCWLVNRAGLEIPISDIATPTIAPDGEIVGSIVVFQDNTAQIGVQVELWERNQDLEFFHQRLLSQLEVKTAEYQQAIACLQVVDPILSKVRTVRSERELLQIAIEQLGIAIDADYAWVTLHDDRAGTAKIGCEYINRERQIYPTSKIGKEIDVLLYPRFYNHLFERESWIDPPLEIIPKPYLDLVTPAAQLLICPINVDLGAEYRSFGASSQGKDGTIGEIGILTTGKPPWTIFHAQPIANIFSCAVKLFRQTQLKSIGARAAPPEDRDSTAKSFAWLNSLKDDFISSIAITNRDLDISAQMLQRQIHSIDLDTDDLSVVLHHQSLHRELAVNLEIVKAEWQRQFQLIDILMDFQVNGAGFPIQSLSDVLFDQWIASIVKSCGDLATRQGLDFSYRITDLLPPLLLCPLPMLELIIVELFHNACKYTPPDYPIILEVDIRDNQLQVSVVSLEIEISARELETIFLPFTNDLLAETASEDEPPSAQPINIGFGLALVNKLVPYLGGKIEAHSEGNAMHLTLTLPLASDSHA
jgi:signal transduction histidine kinase/CheY-like chemotaxis protein